MRRSFTPRATAALQEITCPAVDIARAHCERLAADVNDRSSVDVDELSILALEFLDIFGRLLSREVFSWVKFPRRIW